MNTQEGNIAAQDILHKTKYTLLGGVADNLLWNLWNGNIKGVIFWALDQ